MSLTEVKCFLISCDTCKKDIENMNGISLHHETQEDAEEDAREEDWTVWNEYYWCDSCNPPDCTCGHLYTADHDYGEASCQEEECDCQEYKPELREEPQERNG